MSSQEKKGIGGWLLVYTIFLILSILFFISIIASAVLASTYEFPLIFIGIWIICAISAFFLLIYKKKAAPRMNILLWWFFLIVLIIDESVGTRWQSAGIYLKLTSVLIDSIMPVIWTIYFLKSERVKRTFVN